MDGPCDPIHMQRALIDNWALFAGILMLMVANGLMMTLLTIRGSELGFSSTVVGIMQAGYPAGALIGTVIAPRLIEGSGHVRAFAALASLCSISAIIHLLTDDPYTWTAMRVLAGFCFPGLYVITESWLNGEVENHQRAQVLSVYFFAQFGGQAFGTALIGVPGASVTVLFGTVSILISLSIVPLLLTAGDPPDYEVPERMPMRSLFRISPIAVIGSILSGATMGALFASGPLYGLDLGMTRGQAAGISVALTLAGAVAQYPAAYVADRFDRRGALIGLSAIGCLVVVYSLLQSGEAALTLRFAIMSAACVPVYSVCLAHANDQLRRSQVVAAGGAMAFSLNLGLFFGVFSGPAIMDLMGRTGLMLYLLLLFGLTLLITLLRRVQRESPEETGKVVTVGSFGQPQTAYWSAETMVAEGQEGDTGESSK